MEAQRKNNVVVVGKKNKNKRRQRKNGASSIPGTVRVGVRQQLGDSGADNIISNVIYKKCASGGLYLPTADIPKTLSTSKASYDLYWKMPGYALNYPKEYGNACHLGHTEFHFTNMCDFDLFVRAQRPMGFTADPSCIGMWEPLLPRGQKTELKFRVTPRTTVKIVSSNASTLFMTPRRLMTGGYDHIHLMTFTVYREDQNVHGQQNDIGVALNLKVMTNFRVNDGNVGEEKNGYAVQKHSTTTHMNFVRDGPVTGVRFMDVQPDDFKCSYITFTAASTSDTTKIMQGVGADGKKTTTSFPGLDVMYKYVLPRGIPYMSNNKLLLADLISTGTGALANSWVLTTAESYSRTSDSVHGVDYSAATDLSYVPVFAISEMLNPILHGQTASSNSVTLHTKRASVTRIPCERTSAMHLLGVEALPFLVYFDAAITVIDVLRNLYSFLATKGMADVENKLLEFKLEGSDSDDFEDIED